MATIAANEQSSGPEIGRVWSLGFEALGRRPGEILIVAFIFGGLPTALLRVLSAHLTFVFGTSVWMTLAATLAMYTATSILGVTAAYGLINRLVVSTLEGRSEPVARAIDTIIRRFPILVMMALLVNLGVGFATLLLVVPGVMLMTAWAVALAVASVEAVGPIDALRRSMSLTRGARWPVFGIILVLGIVGGGGGYLVTRFASSFYGGSAEFNAVLRDGWPLWYMAALAVFQSFLMAVSAAVHGALYMQLRAWKDGPQTDTLAEVFA
jgi:hypothetical protein